MPNHRPCKRHSDPNASGLAALATMLATHGVDLSVEEAARLASMPVAPLDLFGMIQVAARLGFTATPLEGSFDDLTQCEFPLIAPLRSANNHPPRLVVIYAATSLEVTFADAQQGVATISSEAFCAEWQGPEGNGDVLVLARHPGGMEAVVTRLAMLRSPVRSVLKRFGLAPPWSRKLQFLACGALLAVGIAYTQSADSWVVMATVAIALALLASLWSWWFASSCRSCGSARNATAGLPLAPMGVGLYFALFAWLLLDAEATIALYALCAAVGVHLGLLALLIRIRSACPACLMTAAAAIAALMLLQAKVSANIPASIAIIAGFSGLGWFSARFARRHAELAAQVRILDIARAIARETKLPPGKVRVVVYKLRQCPACVFYESVIAPALRQDFSGLVELEERDASKVRVPVPLMIVSGNMTIVMRGLQGDDAYEAVKRTVLIAAGRAPKETALPPGIFVAGIE